MIKVSSGKVFHVIFFFVCLNNDLFAQSKKITGTVHDDSNPLEGVSVTIKETNIITSTDDEGRFEILAEKGQELLLTAIGFLQKEVLITDEDDYVISLEKD